MTSEKQTIWKGFTIIYYYPKTKAVVMSGITPEFSGGTGIEDVKYFHLYDLSRIKFIEMMPSFTKIVAKKGESFELEMMVEQMKEEYFDNKKVVELR